MKPCLVPDFPVMLKRLQDAGYSDPEIATYTGLSVKTLCKVRNEAISSKSLEQAVSLLMMFLEGTDSDVPVLGEHYEEMG